MPPAARVITLEACAKLDASADLPSAGRTRTQLIRPNARQRNSSLRVGGHRLEACSGIGSYAPARTASSKLAPSSMLIPAQPTE